DVQQEVEIERGQVLRRLGENGRRAGEPVAFRLVAHSDVVVRDVVAVVAVQRVIGIADSRTARPWRCARGRRQQQDGQPCRRGGESGPFPQAHDELRFATYIPDSREGEPSEPAGRWPELCLAPAPIAERTGQSSVATSGSRVASSALEASRSSGARARPGRSHHSSGPGTSHVITIVLPAGSSVSSTVRPPTGTRFRSVPSYHTSSRGPATSPPG